MFHRQSLEALKNPEIAPGNSNDAIGVAAADAWNKSSKTADKTSITEPQVLNFNTTANIYGNTSKSPDGFHDVQVSKQPTGPVHDLLDGRLPDNNPVDTGKYPGYSGANSVDGNVKPYPHSMELCDSYDPDKAEGKEQDKARDKERDQEQRIEQQKQREREDRLNELIHRHALQKEWSSEISQMMVG